MLRSKAGQVEIGGVGASRGWISVQSFQVTGKEVRASEGLQSFSAFRALETLRPKLGCVEVRRNPISVIGQTASCRPAARR